jgi:hypothetical protein
VAWLGWRSKRSTKKYKTLHPYRDGLWSGVVLRKVRSVFD